MPIYTCTHNFTFNVHSHINFKWMQRGSGKHAEGNHLLLFPVNIQQLQISNNP